MSVVNVILVDSSRNPLKTTVRTLGLPSGRTVASWKNVEYFRCLFASKALFNVDFHATAIAVCKVVHPFVLTCWHDHSDRHAGPWHAEV